jgi:hypothetical protein
MDVGHCQCARISGIPCHSIPTAEDLLCDFCRTARCGVIAFNDGEFQDCHVVIDTDADFGGVALDNKWVRLKLDELARENGSEH